MDLGARGVHRDAADLTGQAEIGRQGCDGHPVLLTTPRRPPGRWALRILDDHLAALAAPAP
jgi:hypothetical protein